MKFANLRSIAPRVPAALLQPLPLMPQREPALRLGRPEMLELEVRDNEIGRLLDRLENVDEPVPDDVDLRRAATLARKLQIRQVSRGAVVVGLRGAGKEMRAARLTYGTF